MRTFLVEQAVMKTENETTSFCTVSKLGLLDKFGEDCFFFFLQYNNIILSRYFQKYSISLTILVREKTIFFTT